MWQRLAFESTFTQIAERLNISVSTAQRIFTLFKVTGSVSPKLGGPRRYMRKLDDHMELFIIGTVLEKPSMFLSELRKLVHDYSSIDISAATVCRLLHRHGLTRQKIKQVALQRSFYLRGYFMSQVLLYDRRMFVWLDESGCDNCNYNYEKIWLCYQRADSQMSQVVGEGNSDICDCSNGIRWSGGM